MKKMKALSVLLCLALLLALPGCSLARRGFSLRPEDPGITVELALETEFPVYEVQMICYEEGRVVSSHSTSLTGGRSLSGQLLSFFLPGGEMPEDLILELRFTLLGKDETYRPPPAFIEGEMGGSYYVAIANELGGLYTINDGWFPK